MLRIFKSITNPYNNYSSASRFCFSSSALPTNLNYGQTIVNKFIVTRTKNDKFSLYVPHEFTIGQLKQKITQQLLPGYQVGISTQINSVVKQMNKQANQKQQEYIFEKIKDIQLRDALMLNKVCFYQKNQKKQIVLIYGLQIAQQNLTNRINIPEHVEQAIAQLNYQWSSKELTIGQALSFANIPKMQQQEVVNSDGQVDNTASQFNDRLTKQQQIALSQSVAQLIRIKRFQQQIIPNLAGTKKLMKRIIAIMSINWVFLFYLTYAKYGWDVGQPVSYLTGLGVDLAAITGLFEANNALSTQKQNAKKAIQESLNFQANQQMAKWRVAYLTRKLNS